MVIENLKSAGVHQAAKDDRISFTALDGWPGTYISAEGRYLEGGQEAGSQGEAFSIWYRLNPLGAMICSTSQPETNYYVYTQWSDTKQRVTLARFVAF